MEILNSLWNFILLIIIISGALPLSYFFTYNLTRGARKRSFAERLLCLLFFWCLFEVLTGLLTGIIGQFNLTAVAISEIFLFAAGLYLLYENRSKLKGMKFSKPGFSGSEKLTALFFSLIFACLVLKILLYPPGDSDSLAFHMPAMAVWFQKGSLWEHLQIPYPYNWEVLSALFILPYGRDTFAAMPNIVSLIILGLSVYLILRTAEAGKFAGMSMSLLVMTIPEILNNVNTFHIDLAFAAFFTAGVYFLFMHYKTGDADCIVMVLFSIMMLLGIKASGLPYGILLLAAAVVLIFIKTVRKSYPKFSISVPAIVLLIVSFPLAGSFWYIKNFIETGNPLAFVKISLFGKTLFPGIYSPADLSKLSLFHIFKWSNPEHWKIIFLEILKRFQLPFVLIAVLGLCAVFMLFFKRIKELRINIVLFLSLALSAGFLYWSTPFSADNPLTPWIGAAFRYGFPFIAMLGVLAGIALPRIKIGRSVVIFAAGACMLAGLFNFIVLDTLRYDRSLLLSLDARNFPSILAANPGIMLPISINMAGIALPYAVLSAAVILAWLLKSYDNPVRSYFKKLTWSKNYLFMAAAAVFIAALLGSGLYFMQKQRDAHRAAYYGEIPEYIDRHIISGEAVGSLYCDIIYPLYGKRLNIPVYSIDPDLTNFSELIGFLKKRNIRYIDAGPVEGPRNDIIKKLGNPIIGFLEKNNGAFARVAGEDIRSIPIPDKSSITETDYFLRKDRGRALYRLK